MKKIVIIGGGMSGLVAGIYAQKAGFESEIYERNDKAGGLCTGWTRNGHYIDNCVHWLTGTEQKTQLRRLWEETGALTAETAFVPNEAFYSSIYNGVKITLWKDLERTEREFCQLSPEDSEEIHDFIESVRIAQCRKMPVDKPMEYMSPSELMQLGKSMQGIKAVKKKYGNISLKEYVKRFKSLPIQKVMTDFYSGDSAVTSIIFSYASISCGNGEIPVGGSEKMIERMTSRYLETGGKLYLNHPVKKVHIKENEACSIELNNGFNVEGDYFICAADTYEAFYHLIGEKYIPEEWKLVYNQHSEYPVYSKFQMAISVNRDGCPIEHMTFIDCDKIKVAVSTIDRICIVSYGYESSFAPEGKLVLQIKIEQNETDYNYWSYFSEIMYQKKKQEFGKLVMEQLLIKYPELRDNYEILDIWTPRTYHTRYNAFQGSFMRFRERADVKAFASNGKFKSIPNLYIASQWLQAPGGLPTAAAAGKFAIQHILKAEGKYVLF
ncbi:phytoene desaturase family protein [Anaeromicropila populeti]|uniref:Phytoene dehydrogenase-related protein n=1 Tax=Anaeromicropila populeti TaxID=37658 RepID=A0A1I6JT33_9FIRM|nr:NAD(P)/FAD-dependent oxidoreductase [Anaeromicropila populeti]SFR82122.1 Phytoene dehydrogenase-related protein [Anaeromicropila populeti]